MNLPVLGIVIPCYNEENTLLRTAEKLTDIINQLVKKNKIAPDSFLLFVDDGSKDSTWEVIENACRTSENIKGVRLAKNAGHQNALLAGMMRVKEIVDMVISIDCDLEQDANAIFEFIEKYHQGNEIVYGVRKDRQSDRGFKKMTAQLFYSLMKWMGAEIIRNHADYRLVGKRALKVLEDHRERHLFLRGLFLTMGFKTDIVHHTVRSMRDETRYPLKKMLSLAINGITSFSVVPLRFIGFIGFAILIFSLCMIGYSLIVHLLGKTVAGWTSTVLPIYFIGGIQLLSLGVIGEYIGKIYMETKHRPRYIIDTELIETPKEEPRTAGDEK